MSTKSDERPVRFRRGQGGEAHVTVDGGDNWYRVRGLSNEAAEEALGSLPMCEAPEPEPPRVVVG